jgi:cytoskeletal protein CcmA (bactofilin family)
MSRSNNVRIDTLVAKSVTIHGDLDFTGGLHLDGRIEGNVRADPQSPSALSVSDTGSIEGSVEATEVVLHGTVRGDIVARERVVLGASARVAGDVYYGVIEMTLGAQITGRLVRLTTGEAPQGAARGAAEA